MLKRLGWFAIALLVACVYLLLLSATGAATGQTSANELIVFASNRQGNVRSHFNIFSVRADGSELKRIAASDLIELNPVLSPDGKKIAFVAKAVLEPKGNLFVMNVDGSNRRQLTQNLAGAVGCPAWSPDGKRIALAIITENVRDSLLLTMDISGGDLRYLGKGRMPAWSPDGAKIMFLNDDKNALWVMHADGSNPKALTNILARSGAWSADGNRIVYASGNADLFVADGEGGSPVRLTDTVDLEIAPQWSWDGQRIYFTRVPVESVNDKRIMAGLYVIDANGKNERQLTNGNGVDLLGTAGNLQSVIAR